MERLPIPSQTISRIRNWERSYWSRQTKSASDERVSSACVCSVRSHGGVSVQGRPLEIASQCEECHWKDVLRNHRRRFALRSDISSEPNNRALIKGAFLMTYLRLHAPQKKLVVLL